MACFLSMTCTFTFLLICLVPSKAMLFPPKNLTIGLLDFNGTAEWLPGQRNPFGTKYTLEFIPAEHMSGGKWIPAPNCTNITILKCNLTFDQHPDELFSNYFVRVKTTFKGISSNWTTTSKSFQPYGDTRLSSPDVNISRVQNSIDVNFSHRLESKPGIKPLEFHLYLYEESPTGESKLIGEAMKPTSKSPHVFPDVPPGKNYCVSVSASHQQASKHNNFNTTQCIPPDSPISVVPMVCIAAILLITFLTGIVVTVGCFCEKNKNHQFPNALIFVSRYNSVLKLIYEAFQTPVQIHKMNIEDSIPAPEDTYLKRENLTNVVIIPSSIANVNQPEQAEEAERSHQCYKNTLVSDLEHSGESEISEKDDDDDDDDDDDMHPVTPEFSCAFPSNILESKILKTITVNTFENSETDGYCAEDCYEETVHCSSGNDCEREVPAEEKEEEHVSFLADDSSEPRDYEPRHCQLFMD